MTRQTQGETGTVEPEACEPRGTSSVSQSPHLCPGATDSLGSSKVGWWVVNRECSVGGEETPAWFSPRTFGIYRRGNRGRRKQIYLRP